ncbi:hypothetical protein OKW39_007351 [Paraburkholderia sp. MM6662-R1]
MPVTTTLTPWAAHDTQLILSCALGLALIIIFISVLKLAPFLSIMVGTFAAGFTACRSKQSRARSAKAPARCSATSASSLRWARCSVR